MRRGTKDTGGPPARIGIDARIDPVSTHDQPFAETAARRSAGFEAGLAGRMTLIAVNGRAFVPHLLKEAILGNRDGLQPIELIAKSGAYDRAVRIDDRGGPRYPHLVRIDGTPDGYPRSARRSLRIFDRRSRERREGVMHEPWCRPPSLQGEG